MTQQHFSTDHMLTNTIENRQFGTMGEWWILVYFLLLMELSSSSRNFFLNKKAVTNCPAKCRVVREKVFRDLILRPTVLHFIKRELEIAIKMDSPFSFQELGFQYISIP